jgi:hypothetical protein
MLWSELLKSRELSASIAFIVGAGIDANAGWGFGQVDLEAMCARPAWSDLYGRPLSKERLGRYRTNLTSDDVKVIEEEAADLLTQFNYESQ